jgi:hypothetical protein
MSTMSVSSDPTGSSAGGAAPGADETPPGGDREPGDRRPGRHPRLDVPPSQRYARTTAGEVPVDDQPSQARGVVLAVLVAAFCGAILVVLGGAFGFTAGLIVVAFFLGRLTAIAMTVGAGPSITTARRMGLSILISLAAILVAQLGLWAWARTEGGSLGPVDFLAQTYGVLVYLELLLAGGAAWLKAS